MTLSHSVPKVFMAAVFAALLLRPAFAGAQSRIVSIDSTVSIELPSSFGAFQVNAQAKLQFADTLSQSFVVVFLESKKDLVGWNLTRHSMITISQLLTSIDMPEVIGPRQLSIGGYPAVQSEIRGAMQGTRIAYLHTTIEAPAGFAQTVAWTAESKWTDNEQSLQRIANTVRIHEPGRISTDMATIIPGTWAWERDKEPCKGLTQRFEIAADGKSMKIHHSEPIEGFDGQKTTVTDYVIEGSGTGVLHTYIPGETRQTDSGDPAKWDLVAVARNRIAWHRADWPEGSVTGLLRRCDIK